MEPETARKSIRPGDVLGFEDYDGEVVQYYRVVDVGREHALIWGPASLGDQRGLLVIPYQEIGEYIPRENAGDVFQDLAAYPEDDLPEFGGWEDRRRTNNVDEDRKESSGDVQDDDVLEDGRDDADAIVRELEKEATE